MAAPVGSLVVRVGSDIRGLTSGTKRGSKNVKDLGRAADTAGKRFRKSFSGMAGSVANVGKAMTSLRGLVAAFVGAQVLRGLSSMVTSTIDLGDQFSKLNTRLGLSVEFLSDMRFAADRTGVGFDTLTMGFQRVIRRMEEFKETGKGPAAEGFKALGDGIADAVKRGESFESLLPRIADGFQRLGSDQLRVLTAMRLFDSEGVKLVQLFKDGAQGIDALRRKSDELGARWTDLQAREMAEMKDSLTNLGTGWEGLKREMTLAIGPPAIEMMETFEDALREMRRADTVLPPLFPASVPTGPSAGMIRKRSEEIQRLMEQGNRLRQLQESGRPLFSGFGDIFVKEGFIDEDLVNLTERVSQNFAELVSNATRFSEIAQRRLGFDALQELLSGEGQLRKEALERRLEQIRQALSTERELETEAFAQRMEDLRSGLELGLLTEEEFRQQREQLEKQHQDTLSDIEEKGIRKRDALAKAKAAERMRNMQGQFDAIANLTSTLAATLFQDSKAAAIVDATVQGIAGAIRTWNAYPYPWNIIPTAAHIAGTAARIAQLKSTTFGGGGGGAAAPAPAAAVAVPAQATSISNVSISLQGDRFSPETVRELIHEINEAVGDGARIRVR